MERINCAWKVQNGITALFMGIAFIWITSIP
jgi:hypothetical protein